MFVNSYFQIATFFIFYDEILIFNSIYFTEWKIEYLSLLIFHTIFVRECARAPGRFWKLGSKKKWGGCPTLFHLSPQGSQGRNRQPPCPPCG